jgi:hypothetical protein
VDDCHPGAKQVSERELAPLLYLYSTVNTYYFSGDKQKVTACQAWWHILIIPALRRLR